MSENNLEFVEINFEPSLCVICQKDKKHAVNATEKGINGLKRSCEARKKKHDVNFGLAIDRIDAILNDDDKARFEIKYHADCYATFTSKSHILRLRDKELSVHPVTSNLDLNGNPDSVPSSNLDSNGNFQSDIDWSKCIFCQQVI